MLKAVLLFVMVASVAQVFPSCGGAESGVQVIGWVEAKRIDYANDAHVITINHTEYGVPAYFWYEVRVGDLVKWDGITWTIVKRAGS